MQGFLLIRGFATWAAPSILFKVKPLIRKTQNHNFQCPDLRYWFAVSGALALYRSHQTSALTSALHKILASYTLHTSNLSSDTTLAVNDKFGSVLASLESLDAKDLYPTASDAVAECTQRAIVKSTAQWKEHVRLQLARGGGTLFNFIAKQDKQHLNADITNTPGNLIDPDVFLSRQTQIWKELWHPSDEVANIVSVLLHHFRADAISDLAPRSFTHQMFDDALKGYHKGSLGVDCWHPAELRGLPAFARNSISDIIQKSFTCLVWPHQQLLSLNPCLGKPNGGVRTVCKTPMLYRMAIRAVHGAADWEKTFSQHYDKAKSNSSAHFAAVQRNFRLELHSWSGNVSAVVFNDFAKFFDTIDIQTLLT